MRGQEVEQDKEERTMQRVLGFVGHLISAMLKSVVFTGVAAAILCAVVLFLTLRTG
jgi:hypothetical protein